ncbi:MAG: Heparin-sulfate lyase precursor [Lentisphaerae bacterium ADurb.BinA184]|nr:MAG: Heparin-sulfate lyase precursor [Lentisphaerae bacterium ADurb.BinA184]
MSPRTSSTLAWVCEHHLPRVKRLVEGLDPELPTLAPVRAAVAAGEWQRACAALLAHYRTCFSGGWLRHGPVPVGDRTDAATEKAADAVFAVPGRDVPIPRRPDGSLDWAYVPPLPGGREWVYGINRHDYMTDLLNAFYATGNRRYVRALDAQLHDWCRQVERPAKPGDACPWGTVLEPGHRVKVWPAVFYGLQSEEDFSAATRILVLSQALDHAEFLDQFHAGGSNWIVTEMAGLFSVACAWPEFRRAAAWREVALRTMQSEMRDQVYPDGVQKELSSNYQVAVLWHLGHFVATARGAGVALTPEFEALIESLWNYLAYALGPTGFLPHNGDSDRCQPSADSQVIKPLDTLRPILDAAVFHRRPDWQYIATNGAEGTHPLGRPSVVFPWAGQLIMRSGWDADAHWGFFDAGPWGILHQHNDALHLSVTAFGRDLLVDSGRYTYENYLAEPGTWRSYFVNAIAHNVILVDGLVQADGSRLAERPLTAQEACVTPEYDSAVGTFADGFADIATASARLKAILWRQPAMPEADRGVTHTRAVVYLRGVCWVVVDRVVVDRPRRLAPLWHFHPDCTVERQGQSVVTVDEDVGNLRVQPVGPIAWEIDLVRGREGPDFQGWYSPEMDVRLPNTCACYDATVPGTATFAWVLLPARGAVPEVQAGAVPSPDGTALLELALPDGRRVEIGVRLAPDVPLRLRDGTAVGSRCAVRWIA